MPRSFASSMAATRFALMLRSRLPPPTEKIHSTSFAVARLPRNHAAKTVSQPSSLVRAVSSETLSTGL